MLEAEAEASLPPTPASATREDVIAALRCHAVMSSAMAARMVMGGEVTAAYGIREQTLWFQEADRRAKAAGVTEAEFTTLVAEIRAPMTTEAQRAENQPILNECLANLPGS